jgi:hypothetical protein
MCLDASFLLMKALLQPGLEQMRGEKGSFLCNFMERPAMNEFIYLFVFESDGTDLSPCL